MAEATYVKVCNVPDLPPGSLKSVDGGPKPVVLANVEGSFFAMEGICKHAGWNLSQGKLVGKTIVCSGHGAEWDLETGTCTKFFKRLPNERTYEVKIENDAVYLRM